MYVIVQMEVRNKSEEYKTLVKIEMDLDKLLNQNKKEIDMKLLHEYNDVKDAAQTVIQYLANVQGTTIGAIHRRLQLLD